MGLLDTARNLLRSPAERRLIAAEREAWQSAPGPSTKLAAQVNGTPATPPIDWRQDQPPPAPQRFTFQPNYYNHAYQQFAAPLVFDGFGLERIHNAVAQHRIGYFWESSALMVSVMAFAPVLAALQQAIAPILALPRHVHGGDRGLAKLVALELEEALVPRRGLLPSPYLPPTLWGTLAIYLRMMGFGVLQHIDGDPDPDTGIRPRYTRIWEPWAVQRYRSPRKNIALTTEGPVEITNDGKFTMVEDEQEGHLSAAICALGRETLGGQLTQDQRLDWLDFFSKPKLYATLPEKVPTGDAGQAGHDFFASVETIYGPDGRGVLPHGSLLNAVAIPGDGADQFQAPLLDAIVHIFMVLVGSAGTIGNGMNTGAGQSYQPAKGGSWAVRHDLIARPTQAIVRAINQGHCAPYQDINYADAIARAKKAGAWKYAVLEIPIPAPDRDERIDSEIKRYKALSDQVTAETAAGAPPTQDRVDALAEAFEVRPFTLADPKPQMGQVFDYHIQNKLVAPDEVRAGLHLPPLPNGAGTVDRLAQERMEGGDQVGALAKEASAEAKPPEGVAPQEPGPEDASSPNDERS